MFLEVYHWHNFIVICFCCHYPHARTTKRKSWKSEVTTLIQNFKKRLRQMGVFGGLGLVSLLVTGSIKLVTGWIKLFSAEENIKSVFWEPCSAQIDPILFFQPQKYVLKWLKNYIFWHQNDQKMTYFRPKMDRFLSLKLVIFIFSSKIQKDGVSRSLSLA